MYICVAGSMTATIELLMAKIEELQEIANRRA
jgi:hypothetical protein